MINRMSHKKRILLEYIPYGVNVILLGIFFLIHEISHPAYEDIRILIAASFRNLFDIFSSLRGFLIFITSIVVVLPMFFSIFIMLKEDYLDLKMKLYDKRNNTKTYDAYYDESYEKNSSSASSLAFVLCFFLLVIEFYIFLFVRVLPNTALCVIILTMFPVGFYMVMYGLFFCAEEKSMLSSYSDDEQECIIA